MRLRWSRFWLVRGGLFNNHCNYVWSKSCCNFLSKCSHWTPCCLLIHQAEEIELEPNRLFTEKWMSGQKNYGKRIVKRTGGDVTATSLFSEFSTNWRKLLDAMWQGCQREAELWQNPEKDIFYYSCNKTLLMVLALFHSGEKKFKSK